MKTSISVSKENRDHLSRIAKDEMHGASMDDALRVILFERDAQRQIAVMQADHEALADYQREMHDLSEQFDQMVHE